MINEGLRKSESLFASPRTNGMNVTLILGSTSSQSLTINCNLIVDGDLVIFHLHSSQAQMNDDAPTEKHRLKRFYDAREGAVGRITIGQSEPFPEPLFSDLAELFHEFIGLHTTNDTGVAHEDDFTKMMLGMATSPGVGQLAVFPILRRH
ncbi:MAG: hypothetical protein ACJAVK_002384 [Akkermansiaceae bacterium]